MSFEYIIVAACIVSVVIAAFVTGGDVSTTLTTGIGKISTAFSGL